jgi:Trk-type K+ transport system membrane component
MLSLLIFLSAALHLAVFVCYPDSGRFGATFLYVSILLWTSLALLLSRAAPHASRENKAFMAVVFALAAALSAISLLPQKDSVSALRKLTSGVYPDGRAVYVGLRRLGIDAPGLLPPAQEEKPL